MLYKAICLDQCILTGIHPKWHFQFPTPWSAYHLCSFVFPRMSQLGPELLFPLIPQWVPALSPHWSLPPILSPSQWPGWMEHINWTDPGGVTILCRTPVSSSHLCQGWRQCDAPRAGLRTQSLFPCAQCPGMCLCILSTHHSVLCRQHIHDTRLPFPSHVWSTHIQGSKASCLKIGLEIPS